MGGAQCRLFIRQQHFSHYNLFVMIRIGLRTLQLVALAAVVCMLSVQCDQFNAILTCQKCKMSCAVANCYRLAAPGYDQETCPTVSCELTYNETISVDKCAFDYKGDACSTNVCVVPLKKGICATTVLGFTTCPSNNTFYYETKCSSCVNSSNSANCLQKKIYSQTNTTTLKQVTLGDTCRGVEELISYVYPCTRDIYGGACTCCANITTGTVGYLSCSSMFTPTANKGFWNYAYNKTQFNSSYVTVNSELYTVLSLALFCFMALFL